MSVLLLLLSVIHLRYLTSIMVITGAGNEANIIGLDYIAAFAPDQGDAAAGLLSLRKAPAGIVMGRVIFQFFDSVQKALNLST